MKTVFFRNNISFLVLILFENTSAISAMSQTIENLASLQDKAQIELFKAINDNKPQDVKKAFAQGAKVNSIDRYGKTPLFVTLENLMKHADKQAYNKIYNLISNIILTGGILFGTFTRYAMSKDPNKKSDPTARKRILLSFLGSLAAYASKKFFGSRYNYEREEFNKAIEIFNIISAQPGFEPDEASINYCRINLPEIYSLIEKRKSV